MDLRLFELFCRVYKERSFSRAARELSLTQPTISTHIKELEDALGTQLFNRAGREIQPTEAGHFLYEHAKSLLTLRRSLIEKMAVFLKRVEGVLTVGASSVPGEYLLPALMTGFHAQHPGVCARLRITDTAETIDDIRHGEVELGVVGGTLPDDDLVFEPLASDTLVLIVPATQEWKNRDTLHVARVAADSAACTGGRIGEPDGPGARPRAAEDGPRRFRHRRGAGEHGRDQAGGEGRARRVLRFRAGHCVRASRGGHPGRARPRAGADPPNLSHRLQPAPRPVSRDASLSRVSSSKLGRRPRRGASRWPAQGEDQTSQR